MMTMVILLTSILFSLLQTPEPDARYELVLRLRYPDGRPVVGAEVSLLKLPDRTPVGWQFTGSTCQTDAQGLCSWRLFGGLYEFSFPEGLAPDPITLAELGEGGLNNLSVFLDRDYSMGLVLADPLGGAAGDTLFFDRAPEEPVPQIYIPGPEDARQHHLAPTVAGDVVVVDLDQDGPAGYKATAVTVESPFVVEENAPDSSRLFILLLLFGLVGLAVATLLLYRRFSAIDDIATARHQIDEVEEGDPWA